MNEFIRSLFGFGGSVKNRTVVGSKGSIDAKDIKYIQESNAYLASLYQLYRRYKESLHASRLKAVYDKTRLIHNHLIARGRGHELALFHIQHTEHFINTFSVIMDVHEQKPVAPPEPVPAKEPAHAFSTAFHARQRNGKAKNGRVVAEAVVEEQPVVQPASRAQKMPVLSVPSVSIHTAEKVPYYPQGGAVGEAREIGYLSSAREKEEFLKHISTRLGLEQISYVGNTRLQLPDTHGSSTPMLLPLIHWGGYSYALNLADYRLFSVKMYRQGL